jgi:hypothetical protein
MLTVTVTGEEAVLVAVLVESQAPPEAVVVWMVIGIAVLPLAGLIVRVWVGRVPPPTWPVKGARLVGVTVTLPDPPPDPPTVRETFTV